ncbi:Outer membrane protein (plasmid) [Acidisarcina polymorpha]|uniref:Outer membrane protein n=1 Tax=Acidisarcina polymorpha TaxID=2211140 RepID=A0A2Z5GAN2_9BACT|nr:OmpA family protein [Acidisarcina polymorpha]AXC16312.1 Outer membrane protein [Acidisarcina polymorpha]
MPTERVKVYEEKKKAMPLWYWLLPLLLLLAILAYYFTRHHDEPVATTQEPVVTAPVTPPNLDAIHFDTDSAALTPAAQATLTQAAAAMKQQPNLHLRVEGFTDSTGNPEHNDALSQQRTAAVEKFLVGQGIPQSRLTGAGFGQVKPVAPNSTESGKADNRRVELFQQQ